MRSRNSLGVLVAIVFAGSMLFGARQAYAATMREECPPTHEGGACTDHTNCQQSCDAIFGVGERIGYCNPQNMCCICFE